MKFSLALFQALPITNRGQYLGYGYSQFPSSQTEFGTPTTTLLAWVKVVNTRAVPRSARLLVLESRGRSRRIAGPARRKPRRGIVAVPLLSAAAAAWLTGSFQPVAGARRATPYPGGVRREACCLQRPHAYCNSCQDHTCCRHS